MKKLILPILSVFIGVVAFFFLSVSWTVRTDTVPAEPPMAQIKLADYIEDDMSWELTCKLLQPLAMAGCVDVNINGFYWDCNPCLVRSDLPRHENPDEIILPYMFEDSSPSVSPDPSEQYNLNLIKVWCERNKSKHAEIQFGPRVRFNAVREITNIFHDNNMNFDLLFPDEEGDKQSIIIKLYEPPMKNINAQPDA